nr:MAG TPA: hypothetical protein [Caudoviricetes sp.]
MPAVLAAAKNSRRRSTPWKTVWPSSPCRGP